SLNSIRPFWISERLENEERRIRSLLAQSRLRRGQLWMSAFGGKADIPRPLDVKVCCLLLTQSGHWLAFHDAARSESQLYQNICLSRYDAVSSAAGGWPVNGAPPFSLPDAGDSTAVRLSAPGAVRHDVAHQVVHVVLQISDDVLDDVSHRDHADDLARVQHW